MKTLLLLRHAKSSWDHPKLPDPLRPLARRGKKAAPRMGAFMAREGLVPDLVLCSTAVRARETWTLVERELGEGAEVRFTDDLYHATPGSVLELLNSLADSYGTVLLVGHNPTFEDLALVLAGDGEDTALAQLDRKYPTAALAVIRFTLDAWSDVGPGQGFLQDLVRPKSLENRRDGRDG